ncbi:MAG: TolC family protein [Myxococcales bacterium]|nr:TolC family protein [Myxococcales bacterium]
MAARLALLFLALTKPALAASLSIEDAKRAAVARSIAVAEAESELRAAEGALAQAALLLRENPEVEIGYSSDAFFAREREADFELSLSQSFEMAGQRGARREAARLRKEAAAARLTQARADAEAASVSAYGRLSVAERRLGIARDAEKLAVAAAEAAEKRLERGDVSEVDASLLAADAAQMQAQVQAFASEREEAREALASAMGTHLPEDLELSGPVPAPESSELAALGEVGSLAQVRARQLEALGHKAELDLAKRSVVPDVTVSVGYGEERASLDSPVGRLEDQDRLLGMRLTIPLPLWNRNKEEIARASAASAAAERKAEAARELAPVRLSAAAKRAQLALEAERRLSKVLPRINRSLETVQQAFERGQLSLAELLLKRDALLKARFTALSAELERVLAVAELSRLRARAEAGENPR